MANRAHVASTVCEGTALSVCVYVREPVGSGMQWEIAGILMICDR